MTKKKVQIITTTHWKRKRMFIDGEYKTVWTIIKND